MLNDVLSFMIYLYFLGSVKKINNRIFFVKKVYRNIRRLVSWYHDVFISYCFFYI